MTHSTQDDEEGRAVEALAWVLRNHRWREGVNRLETQALPSALYHGLTALQMQGLYPAIHNREPGLTLDVIDTLFCRLLAEGVVSDGGATDRPPGPIDPVTGFRTSRICEFGASFLVNFTREAWEAWLAEYRAGRLGSPPASPVRRRGRPGVSLAEAEVLVLAWLKEHARQEPAAITQQQVAEGTGMSRAQVGKTDVWELFDTTRKAVAKPKPREVPLSDEMKALIPADCKNPAELVELIEQQQAEKAEEERRHKSRHK